MAHKGWIAVDLDGTLAEYHGWQKDNGIGKPVPLMVARVRKWLRDGKDVRIFTARVAHTGAQNEDGVMDDGAFARNQRKLIGDWCEQYLGRRLPVTATKDMHMIEMWDDRCVRVEENTGRVLSE